MVAVTYTLAETGRFALTGIRSAGNVLLLMVASLLLQGDS